MTRWKTVCFIYMLLSLSAELSCTKGAEGDNVIIPDSFTAKNISDYRIRYLSEQGNDTESCLSGQVYPRPPGDAQYCGSLLYALTGGQNFHSDDQSNVIVLILPGRYPMGEKGIEINNYRNIILKKMPGTSDEVVVRCNAFTEDRFNNLFVTNATNLLLDGIVFTECGPKRPPVRLQNTFNATVTDCTFRRNRICGLTIDGSSQAFIVNSRFHDNNSTTFYNYTDRLDPAVFRFGGGLLLSWNSTEDDEKVPSTTAVINNCTFFNNYAGINKRNSNDSRPHFYLPRGHGGAIVVAFKNSDNHTLIIENSRIYNNTAQFGGGGIILSFFRTASKNTVIINNTSFDDNICSTDGGAINMNAFEMANENSLFVMNSNFTKNKAIHGGGACSVNLRDNLQMTMSEVNEPVKNTATFINCSFTNNSSPEGAGSAVNLVSNLRVDQVVAATKFTNCTFTGNQAKRQSAVLSFRYPIIFSGKNIFKVNMGGGVTLQQTNMDVGGILLFEDNYAKYGGAISLEDLCVIYLLEGSEVAFIRNSAETQGGAISALFPSDSNVLPIFNTRCFIQYKGNIELDSSQWNTSLMFINNTAAIAGAAIYATSIGRCIYTPTNVTGETTFNLMYESSIFQVSPPFTFIDNQLSTSTERNFATLATAPSDLIVTPQNTTAAPGETVQFLVKAIDQAGNPQEAIWSVTEKSESKEETNFVGCSNVGDYFGSLADGINHSMCIQKVNKDLYYKNCFRGIPRSFTFSLVQAIAGDVSTGKKVNVTVTCCYPGYHFDNNTEVCEHNHNDNNIVRPGANNRYLYTKDNVYVDKYTVISNMTEELKTAVIPPTFHSCEKQGAQPGCKFRFDSLEDQCSQGRTGFLCGQCPGGEGVDLTLRQCKECSISDAIIVAIIVLAFIITSLLVLYFNIGIPNELKGCLFYIQVVGFVYQSSRTDKNLITWDYHLSRVFGSGLYLPLCPSPGYTALPTALYGLMFSLLAISILIIYVISARFSKRLSSRTSFDGIWFLSIIIYKYTADTCFNLLRCQKISGKGISREFVYYFDGTVRCFNSTHLYISIIALLLSITVAIPFPLLIFLISFRRFKFTQPFTDVLNKDIKVSCRWWSGFDLLRRLLFITVVFFFNYIEPRYTQLALFFAGLLTFVIFASAKPYLAWSANIIEAAVLLNLLLLTGLFLNVNLSKISQTARISEQILLLLPFLLINVYIVIHVAGFIWKRFSRKSFKMFVRELVEIKGKQHTTVSHNLEVISDMETEENAESDSEDGRDTPLYREELLVEN